MLCNEKCSPDKWSIKLLMCEFIEQKLWERKFRFFWAQATFPALVSKHCRFIWPLIPSPVQSFASSSAPGLIGLQVSLVRPPRDVPCSWWGSVFSPPFPGALIASRCLRQQANCTRRTEEEIAFILEGACLNELWLTAMFALVTRPRFRRENEQEWFSFTSRRVKLWKM